jgi:hypothetical protein
MNEELTLIQAYKAMLIFIEEYYYRGGEPDEIGLLLGIMQLLDDGKPADPAMWNDWITAVNQVMEAG